MNPRRGRGLTLLELAIALAVLAVLSALAIPSFGARLDRQRVQGAAQALAGDLAEARFEAARRGQPLFVQASAGADWCWAVATSEGCDCAQAQACQLHAVRAGSRRSVRLLEGLAVRLDPAGAAQAGPGTQAAQAAVLATPRGETLRVEMSALGRPRVCALSGSWPGVAAC